jgi:hypothetical protein
MKPLKIEEDLYYIGWKYKDFLKIGHEFQGKTIIKLEKKEYLSKECVAVTTIKHNNHL